MRLFIIIIIIMKQMRYLATKVQKKGIAGPVVIEK